MPGNVDHCWTTPSVCTNGDCDPLQRHSYSPISDWWHRLYIEIWGPAIYRAWPKVSITHKDFTRCQIVLHNPSVKLAIQCAFTHPFTNKLHLRYWLPLKHISCDNILQFVTYVVQRMGIFCKLIQYIIFILSSISSPCIIPSLCLSHCPSHYYPVAFQDRFAQVFQIYSYNKISWLIFSAENVTHLNLSCQYIKLQNAQIKLCFRQQLDACRQKHLWEAVLLFWG